MHIPIPRPSSTKPGDEVIVVVNNEKKCSSEYHQNVAEEEHETEPELPGQLSLRFLRGFILLLLAVFRRVLIVITTNSTLT